MSDTPRARIYATDQRPPQLRASMYTRVSKDVRKGTGKEAISVDSQERECRRVADDEGWAITGKPYCDNDVSASKYSRKTREDWPKLLADMEAGRFDVLIMWESSRGSRKLSEWSQFLEMAAESGVLIHIVSHDRTYDVRKGRDWKTLAGDGVDAEASSNETSQRVRRLKAATRSEGRPDGRVCFGHKREYDPDTRELLRQVAHPLESLVVREIFDRILGGDSLVSITNDLNRRRALPKGDPEWVAGLPSKAPYRIQAIRQIATRAAHAGKIRHEGELFDAQWDPIVPFDQWQAVQQILGDPARRTSIRPGRVQYLLSRIMLCGVCGSYIEVKRIDGKQRYHCRGVLPDGNRRLEKYGCTAILMDEIEDYVLSRLVKALCSEDLVSLLSESDDTGRQEARTRMAEMRAELDAAWSKVYAREPGYTHERVAQMEASWMPEIERLDKEANAGLDAATAVASALIHEARQSGLEGSELELVMREAVDAFPLPGKRQMIRKFLSPIRLHRVKKRGVQPFDPSRIEIG